MVVLKVARLLAIILILFIGVFFVAIASIIDLVFGKPVTILFFAQLWYRSLLRVLNVRVTVAGKYKHQAVLICSNHISWLDIPIVGSVLPTYFLSKAELRSIPILGWLAHHAGTLFIQRGSGQLSEVKHLMQQYLGKDHCLTFFPEATTGNGYAIRQFHPRLFAAAIETETPLLPIAIEYRTYKQKALTIGFGDESMATNLWRVLGRWRTDVTVHVLPIVQTGELERKVLADTAMHMIADALGLEQDRRGLDFRAPLPAAPIEKP